MCALPHLGDAAPARMNNGPWELRRRLKEISLITEKCSFVGQEGDLSY